MKMCFKRFNLWRFQCPKTSIPPKMIKDNYDIFALKLHNNINNSTDHAIFPVKQKEAGITPVHKKDDRTDKTNYRPVSTLPAVSKFFKKLFFIRLTNLWIGSSRSIYVDSEKVTVLSTIYLSCLRNGDPPLIMEGGGEGVFRGSVDGFIESVRLPCARFINCQNGSLWFRLQGYTINS